MISHYPEKFIMGLRRDAIKKENAEIVMKMYYFETITQLKKCKNQSLF